MLINNTESFDQTFVASSFNDYFVNIGPDLSAKIPNNGKVFTEYLNIDTNNCIISELSLEEFKIAFKTLKSNKSNGFDDINSNIIKKSFDELLIPLFHICKSSLLQGCFPNNMKIAKVTPLFKSGDVDKLCNYRPISILPVFSKLLERFMYNRICSRVINHKLI